MQAGDRGKPGTLKLNCLSNSEVADVLEIAGESGDRGLTFIGGHGIQRSTPGWGGSGVHGSSLDEKELVFPAYSLVKRLLAFPFWISPLQIPIQTALTLCPCRSLCGDTDQACL